MKYLYFIFIYIEEIADSYNGSTYDFDSYRVGSNPASAAINEVINQDYLFFHF